MPERCQMVSGRCQYSVKEVSVDGIRVSDDFRKVAFWWISIGEGLLPTGLARFFPYHNEQFVDAPFCTVIAHLDRRVSFTVSQN